MQPISLLKRRRKKGYKSILDRFSTITIDIEWTEEHCARLDEIAAEDQSCIATAAERTRRENAWVLHRV